MASGNRGIRSQARQDLVFNPNAEEQSERRIAGHNVAGAVASGGIESNEDFERRRRRKLADELGVEGDNDFSFRARGRELKKERKGLEDERFGIMVSGKAFDETDEDKAATEERLAKNQRQIDKVEEDERLVRRELSPAAKKRRERQGGGTRQDFVQGGGQERGHLVGEGMAANADANRAGGALEDRAGEQNRQFLDNATEIFETFQATLNSPLEAMDKFAASLATSTASLADINIPETVTVSHGPMNVAVSVAGIGGEGAEDLGNYIAAIAAEEVRKLVNPLTGETQPLAPTSSKNTRGRRKA